LFLRAGRPRSGLRGRDARAPCFVSARRPVNGRLRITSCPRSFPRDPRPLVVPVVDLQTLVRRFRPGGRLTAADRFITGLGMRTKTALEPIPKVHLFPGTEQRKGKRASGWASKTRHDFSRPHPRPLSRKRERGGCRIGSSSPRDDRTASAATLWCVPWGFPPAVPACCPHVARMLLDGGSLSGCGRGPR